MNDTALTDLGHSRLGRLARRGLLAATLAVGLIVPALVPTAAFAASFSSVPGSVGQADGTVTVVMQVNGSQVTFTPPSGVEITRPDTAYDCYTTAPGGALIPRNDLTSLHPGISCGYEDNRVGNFGTYTFSYSVPADTVPGATLGTFRYALRVGTAAPTIESTTLTAKNIAAPTISTPTAGQLTNNPRPVISGTADSLPGTTLAVTITDADSGAVLGTAPVTDGAWSFTPTANRPEGTNNISVTAALNGVTTSAATRSFVVDTIPPAVPVLASPVAGSATANTTPTVSGTGETGSRVEVRGEGGAVLCEATVVAGAWSCVMAPALTEGSHTLTPVALDEAGNAAPGTPVTFSVITTPPTAPVITSPVTGTVTNNKSPLISGTADSGTIVEIRNAANQLLCSGDVPEGEFECVVAPALAEGSHTLTPISVDAAGNRTPGTPITITVDTVPPAAPIILSPVTGTVTNNTQPTFTGTGETGSRVEIRDGANTVLCTAVVTAGAWSCQPATPLQDGDHALTAIAEDVAGNRTTGTSITITIDTVAPTVPVITAPATGTLTNDATPTITGTGENGSVIEVRGTANALLCTATVANGTWSCEPTMALTEGSHTLTPIARDAAGNTAPGTAVTITVDLTPPAAPVITSPADGALLNTDTPTISGTGENGSTVEIRGANNEVLCSAVVTAGAWSCQISPALGQGDHVLTPVAVDPAGNTAAGTAITITVDTVAPEVPVITAPQDGTITNNATPTVSGTGENGSTVEVRDGAGTVLCTTTVAAGIWSCTLDEPLTEGDHPLLPVARDAAGNEATGIAVTITIDLTPPAAPVITAPLTGTATNVTTPVFTGTGENGSTVQIRAADGTALCSSLVENGMWTCTIAPALDEGMHILSAVAVDTAGNETAGTIVALTIDITPPTVPAITDPVSGTITNDTTPTLSGSGESGSTVEIHNSAGEVLCSAVVSAGSWTCELTTALAEGDHVLTPVAKDAAGNETSGLPVTITVDVTPPAVPVITSPVDGFVTNDPTPTLSGTGETGSTVEIHNAAGDVLCSAVVTAGAWTCDLTAALTEGDHVLTPVAKDAAGNETSGTAITITVDVTPPTVPVITSPVDGFVTNDTTPTLSGTGETGSIVEIRNAADQVLCSVTVTAGAWTCDLAPALGDGNHVLTPVAKDAAGNETAGTAITIEVKTELPGAPIVTSPTDGTITNVNTPTVTGTGENGTTIEVRDAAGVVLCSAPVTGGTWSCVVAPALTDGDHELVAVAVDAATNETPGTPLTITVDTVPPTIPVITAPLDGTVTNVVSLTLSGTGETGSTVEIHNAAGDVLCSAVVTAGAWSCELAPALTEGDHVLTPVATDAAGNETSGTAITITVDVTPPAAPVISSPVDGFVTNDTTPALSGTGETGSTVEIHNAAGDVLCSAVVTAGAWSCELTTALAEGDHVLTPVATDAAGNETSGTAITITVDVTPPAAPVITSPVDGFVTNNTTPTLSGTGETGSTVEIHNAAGDVLCSAVVTAGAWSCDLSPALTEGSHVLTPVATDPAGNETPGTAITITVDLTPPTAPAITSPLDGAVTNDTTPTLSGTGENGSTVTVRDAEDVVLCSAVVTDGTWSCVVSPALAEGDHVLTPTAEDVAGNRAVGAPIGITVDVTPPAVPVITSPLDGAVTNDTTPTLSGTGENGSTVEIHNTAGVVLCSAVVTGGAWSCDLTTALTEGDHVLTPVAKDAAGNEASGTAITITVDVTPPTVPVITSPADGLVTNNTTPTLSGTGENGSTVTVRNAADEVLCSAVVSGGTWSCTLAPALTEGGHVLTPVATDAAGNVSTGTAITITVDTTAPAAPVITTPSANIVTNNTTPTLAGTGETGSTVEIRNAAGVVLCSAEVVDGAWSCVVSPALVDGEYPLTAVAVDAAGNETEGTSVTITVKTTLPAAPVITAPDNGSVGNDTTPTLTGTGENGTTVEVRGPGGEVLCSAVVTNGTWSCAPATALTEGDHTLTPVAVDIAGNETPGNPITLTVDTTPPTPTTDVVCSVNQLGEVTCEGTGTEGDTVVVTDGDGKEICTVEVPAGGHWTCTGGPVTSFPVSVETVDPAGNSGGVHALPAPPIITSPNTGSVLGESRPTLTGTGTPGTTVELLDAEGSVLCSTTVTPEGTWSCTLADELADGTATLTPVATDADGNAFAGISITLNIDTAAPAPPTGVECSANADGTVTCSGTAEPDSTVEITDPEGNLICKVTVGADGTWTCTSEDVVDAGQLIITVIDPAGNRSPSISIGVTPLPGTPGPGTTDPGTPGPGTPGPGTTGPGSGGGSLVTTGADAVCMGALALAAMLLLGSGVFLRSRRAIGGTRDED
ncbi:Ig-like domain-containing protein [Mycetocola saprophilus]|uniref:Ig-like domain-containing protein n=1 Tax=Mycetocola saprophilus TaxID=76636 RepID=UPI0012DF75B1|nr:Ig-like domain-containing protein [Mycetocola saprophilus]